jgi:hypothetical protein
MNCKNCGTSITSNFCPECGQKAKVERITFSYLLNSLFYNVVQIERGFLFTLKELIIRPAKVISEFIEGKRISYYKPIGYVIIMSTISAFVVYFIDLYMRSITEASVIQIERDTFRYFVAVVASFVSKYQSLFYFVMIPVISFCSWVFFAKRFNYWENIVLNTYLTAQFNILIVIAQITRLFIDGNVSYTPYLIVYFTYIGIVYSNFFSVTKKGSAIFVLKIVLLMLLVVFAYMNGMAFAGIMSPWWI